MGVSKSKRVASSLAPPCSWVVAELASRLLKCSRSFYFFLSTPSVFRLVQFASPEEASAAIPLLNHGPPLGSRVLYARRDRPIADSEYRVFIGMSSR
jgi:hypothetical protein